MLPRDCFGACHTIECVTDCRFWRHVRRYSGVNRAKKIEDFKKYIHDERKNNMKNDKKINNETSEGIRKTVYIDETLVKRAELVKELAGADSFSAFVSKALERYITQLMVGSNNGLLTEEIKKAIDDSLAPIDRRLSKGLYRYAVELDMLSLFVGFDNDFRWDEIECIRKEAGRRIAQMRGKIDVGEIICEMSTVNEDYYDED